MNKTKFTFFERKFREEVSELVHQHQHFFTQAEFADYTKAVIHSRGLVQKMQAASILPEKMSTAKFNATALAIAALVLELEEQK